MNAKLIDVAKSVVAPCHRFASKLIDIYYILWMRGIVSENKAAIVSNPNMQSRERGTSSLAIGPGTWVEPGDTSGDQ